MRCGTVIYLTDAASLTEDLDDELAIKNLGLDPKWTIIAADLNGYYDLIDATQVLIVRGAKHIEALRAFLASENEIQPFGEPVRMFG
ncbi:MAG: hypothetical protein JRJ19_05980 [Deltaproteobacteria bacterium]|nr:hypothetical protein [Deltaproteobacteria bacterium]MBW1871593.1 hypothetical protein [Deltaproteobacteria bacterium]